MRLVLFIFLFSNLAKAESVPLPSSVLGVNEIVEEFRGTLKNKIVALGKNYISQVSDKTIIFKNSEDTKCNGVLLPKDSAVSSFKLNFNLKDDELNEKVIYSGCSEISLVEDVVTRGINLKPITFNDFIRGNRSFDLKDNETFKLYKVSNLEGDEIFKVMLEKSGNSRFESYFYLGQKFLTINFEFNTSSTKAIFTAYSYQATYKRKHGTWSSRSNYSPYSFTVVVDKMASDQVAYYDQNRNRISLSNFLSLFNMYILDSTLSNLQSIFDYHTYYFPSTEVTKSGAASQRLLEELRVNQSRLLTNTELNLVRNFIQDLINATESGFIQDNRPKEQ